jgi:ribonuclease-3
LNEHPEESDGDNQRLEFLGDAVLDFVAGLWVYNNFPEFQEGAMTRLRAALVRTEMLSQWAKQLHLDQALRLGKGEEGTGGRWREANLCDAFEALIGAMYLDGGWEPVRKLLEPLIAPAAARIHTAQADWDAKSRLQEWSQAKHGITPRYRIVEERGPDHAKTFLAEVLLGDRIVGHGEGHNKQAAEQSAAQAAWEEVAE